MSRDTVSIHRVYSATGGAYVDVPSDTAAALVTLGVLSVSSQEVMRKNPTTDAIVTNYRKA